MKTYLLRQYELIAYRFESASVVLLFKECSQLQRSADSAQKPEASGACHFSVQMLFL